MLTRDSVGNWTVSSGTSDTDQHDIISVAFEAPSAALIKNQYTELLLMVESSSDSGLDLGRVPLNITVNGQPTNRMEDELGYYTYTPKLGQLTMEVIENNLCVTPYIDGTYSVELEVPGGYTVSGQPIKTNVVLTVSDTGGPTPLLVPIPTANTGLRWTGQEQTGVDEGTGYTLSGNTGTNVGQYTAAATLQEGYLWADGSSEPKNIPWEIRKALGPAAPDGLTGTAPSSDSGTDGKITGTTVEMEYSLSADFTGSRACGAGETAGLSAGTYHVRYRETDTAEAGAGTTITVPVFNAPTVTGISVSSTAHKTAYTVGEPLDVSGLTLAVSYSDQTTKTVAVTADMISGFDSSRAAESQTLTIHYEGRAAAYQIRIKEAPPAQTYEVKVSNSHAEVTGAGSYEPGTTVTIHAGSYAGHTFAAWSETGAALTDRTKPDASFTMPANDVSFLAVWSPTGGGETPPPTHTHRWNTAWAHNSSHHWHDCSAAGCPIGEAAQKDGYGPHAAGNWIVDQAATASQAGSRHKECAVCGYVLERETLPATGSGSSGGGSSSGGGGSSSSDSDSSGSGSSGGSGSSSGTTAKNPDGSTTTTSTNQTTGTVTETTRRPDGSKTVTETKTDGTVTVTETQRDGSTVKTVTAPDGSSRTNVNTAGGITASVNTDVYGQSKANVSLPESVVRSARENKAPVPLPIPELSVTRENGSSVTVRTRSVRSVQVEIPIDRPTPGTVAVQVAEDGTETIVRTAVPAENSITVAVTDGATVKLVDNSRDFRDTRSHWAKDAVDFVTARELFLGRTETEFAPEAPMTRGMLMTVLARLDGTDTSGGATAYSKGITWAVNRGVSDGKDPDSRITREQLAAMLYRYTGSPAATRKELRFSDEDTVNGYALEAIRWAVENGILTGYSDGRLAPKKTATRAQVAEVLTRYVNYRFGK